MNKFLNATQNQKRGATPLYSSYQNSEPLPQRFPSKNGMEKVGNPDFSIGESGLHGGNNLTNL